MSLKKQFLKSRPTCKVTFRLDKETANDAQNIYLVGDFNGWDTSATPMSVLKNGDFTATVELDTEQPEYQFRYLCDDRSWLNDMQADSYIANGIDGDNCVVSVQS